MKDFLYKLFKTHKYTLLLVLLFTVSCIQLCAAPKKMSTEEAKEAREKLVEEAKTLLGSRYAYGASGPSSFDCSGFVYYVARSTVKIQLPRTASAIYSYCTPIEDEDREVGDLVFFKTTSSNSISHVGIYIGDGEFISAISNGSNTGVQVRTLRNGYWKDAYCGTAQLLPSGILDAVENAPDAFLDKDNKDQNDVTVSKNKTMSKDKTVEVIAVNDRRLDKTAERKVEKKETENTTTEKKKQESVGKALCHTCTVNFCSGRSGCY